MTGGPLAERLARMADALSDRVNPLVVKEVRQGLRTRVFWISFTLLLIGCVVISLVAYASHKGSATEATGQVAFTAYFACLGLVHFLILPYTSYRSLLKERDDETWVLLTLTGLGPRRILRGKLGSVLVQATLYGSAVAPFLLLSYYLNGVDIPSILLVVALGGVFHAFLTCAALSMSTWAVNRVLRALVGFAAVGGLVLATWLGLQAAFMTVSEWGSFVRDKDVLVALGIGLWAMLSTAVLLFEVAAARLSLPTESYAVGPRVALLVQLLGTVAIWILAWEGDGRNRQVVVAMHVFLCAYLTLAGMFMAIDADGQAARHRAVRGLKRAFTPGALRGFRFIAALLVLMTVLSLLLLSSSHKGRHDASELMPGILAAAAYPLLYLSLPLILSRAWRLRVLAQTAQVRMLFILLALLGMGVPPLVGALTSGHEDAPWLNAFNPAIGLFNLLEQQHRSDNWQWPVTTLVCGTALVAVLLADHLLARRDREGSKS